MTTPGGSQNASCELLRRPWWRQMSKPTQALPEPVPDLVAGFDAPRPGAPCATRNPGPRDDLGYGRSVCARIVNAPLATSPHPREGQPILTYPADARTIRRSRRRYRHPPPRHRPDPHIWMHRYPRPGPAPARDSRRNRPQQPASSHAPGPIADLPKASVFPPGTPISLANQCSTDQGDYWAFGAWAHLLTKDQSCCSSTFLTVSWTAETGCSNKNSHHDCPSRTGAEPPKDGPQQHLAEVATATRAQDDCRRGDHRVSTILTRRLRGDRQFNCAVARRAGDTYDAS